jgi:hypothetical protein
MKLADLSFLLHGTSMLIIGSVVLLTFVVIVILAKYLGSDQ